MRKLRRFYMGGRLWIVVLFLFFSWGQIQESQAASGFSKTKSALSGYPLYKIQLPAEKLNYTFPKNVLGAICLWQDTEQHSQPGVGLFGSVKSFGDYLWTPVSYFLSLIKKISLGYRLLFYLALLTLFFLFNIASVVIVTVISNWIFNRKENYYGSKRKEIIGIVSPYFYDELDQEEEAELIGQLRQYKLLKDKQIVIDVLIEGKRNFIGESSDKIKELYEILQLHKVSLRKIRFGNWYRRSIGLRELAFLGRKGFKNAIKKYINDNHQYVRTEAILSYMLLDEKNPFGFLMELKYSFVRWDSLSIYYTMYFNGIEPPSLVPMLKHPDHQVRLFLLRMISNYNQLDAVKEVTKCLLDENPEIRQEAVITLRSLEYFQIKALMKKRYAEESEPVKMEILRSMKHFIEDYDISFLEERVRKGSFGEVFEAVRILYRYSNYGERKLWGLNEELKGKIEVFIKHVAEPRNKYVA
ncbi:HEAT repeat domain-containing protein [Sunxiuqinia sp. sy24]|uniref:HEAT repeat domain-containing protein n=1 Tax=Sunxiuqinia sp. sy24 TaxID=3461495 RepID=UPI0040454EE7